MNAPPVRCLNALTGALFAPEHILEWIKAWNKSAETEAKQSGADFEPVTVFQLLDAAQHRLDELEPGNPHYPFGQVVQSVLHGAAEAVKAESAMRQIAAANDFMRQHPGLGGEWKLSPAVQALSEEEREQLIQKVVTYEGFCKENDPFREHDRGVVVHNGQSFCFWIEYVANHPNAADAGEYLFAENLADVKRVLTLNHVGECR